MLHHPPESPLLGEVSTPSLQLELVQAPPSFELRDHGHDEPHLCVVTGGAFAERDAGGRFREVPAGTARISPAGDIHHLRMSAAGMSCVLVLLQPTLADGLPLARRREFRRSERLPQLAARVHAAARSATSPIRMELLVLELLAASGEGGPGRGIAPPWLQRIRQALEDAPADPPSTAMLATEAGLHPVYVARAFRRWFGCSLATYAQLVRLEHARRMVLHSTLPLARIAHEAGFADQSHLTRALSRRTGIAPGRLRALQVAGVQDPRLQ